MCPSSSWLRAVVQKTFAAEPGPIQPIGGGSINQAVSLEVGGDRYFVKWNTHAPPSFFQAEARGLDYLRTTGALRVPQVLAHNEAAADHPAYLILEWIEAVQVDRRVFAENFGHALGTLHQKTSPAFGLDHDNYIGELPQSNKQTARWIDFYRDQRLSVQVALARKRNFLPGYREKNLRLIMDRLDTLLDGTAITPSLLHGDLWNGNFLTAAGDQPVVIDPAVYYGHREIEIAFTELFGGFPAGFLPAYREVFPLDPGYEHRRALYQLYPLLVHLNIFGEGYGSSVDAVCRQYLGRSPA